MLPTIQTRLRTFFVPGRRPLLGATFGLALLAGLLPMGCTTGPHPVSNPAAASSPDPRHADDKVVAGTTGPHPGH